MPDEERNGHEERVDKAFQDLHDSLGDRVDTDVRGSLDKLREATADRDADRLREHLADVKERHGWLYEELARHPAVAALVNELALMGL